MTQETVQRLFEETGALLSGHFLLSSGLHSDRYLQAALVLQAPGHALAFGRELAGRFRSEPVTAVVGPALGGIVIAFATAAGLPGTRALFTERENGRFTLRRGFSLGPEDRVLVIEDIITTGGSTREVIELVAASGARVVGVGAIAERGAVPVDFGVRKETLLRLVIESHPPETCPLCRQGLPLVKPGSRTR
ncbi:MAG TPA: orotate phosphoribosyltransferase [bacterium]|nr:orotate phosphoribosyltransferase [bacterium]HNS48390.1 orotate phosphoribosyltransferase [bacterium]